MYEKGIIKSVAIVLRTPRRRMTVNSARGESN
jgi:hypothetical protein